MNESFGADGNSWTTPTTWNGSNAKAARCGGRGRGACRRSPTFERVVGDRLAGDEDAVGRRAQPQRAFRPRCRRGSRSRAASSSSSSVAGSTPYVSCRSGPTYAYEWSTALVDATPGTAAILLARSRCAITPGGAVDDDVGAERELGVDPRLLVVGGGEDAEVHAEREQERDEHEAAIDRRASSAGAREQEPARRRRPARPRRAAASHDTTRPRRRTSSSVAPSQRSAGAKNM